MTLKVLIVDDNRALAENIGEILEDEGYVIAVAESPEEAIARAETFLFDAALLDVRMPGMDGVDLHRALLEMRPCARYFLMTAYAKDDRIAQGLRDGIRAVLPKPIPMDALLGELPPADGFDGYVLIVEDDPAFGATLADLLESAGYRAKCAKTAALARVVANDETPRAVIADVRLPDGDGTELADELHKKTQAPVVMMSAYSTSEAERLVREHYGERGRVLQKPFAPEELLRLLSELPVGAHP